MAALILLVPLAVLVAEDFRSRTVGVVWLVVFAALSLGVSLWSQGVWQTLRNIVPNVLLLVYLAAGVAVYIRIRRGEWMNPLREYIGIGDVVFLLAATPLWGLRGYLLLLIGASVFSLAWMLAARAAGRVAGTIPFAATTGIVLGVAIIVRCVCV